MPCTDLTEINATIFNEYFRNDSNLSNLNSCLIDPTNEYCILDSHSSVLSNIIRNDFITVSGSSSNLNININSFSNIVKSGNTYSIVAFENDNAKHFIPNIPTYLINKIMENHKMNIRNAFNIYQFYDHLVNYPADIYKSNLIFDLYDFFDVSTSPIADANTILLDKHHYKDIIEEHNISKDKLTPSLIYVCRGIYLTLLYKYVAEVYLSYYTTCDELNSSHCPENAIADINILMSKLRSSIEKFTLFTNYSLKVIYDSTYQKLTIDNLGTSAKTYFTILQKQDHIIYNENNRTYIEIPDAGINIDDTNTYYSIANNQDLQNKFIDQDKCLILSKKSVTAASLYDNTMNGLKSTNKKFDEHRSDYQKSITNYEIVNGSFSNIDYIYYLTFLIVIIVLVSIGATNSEQSRKTRVLIILIIVVLTYVMIFSYLEITKRLAESFSTTSTQDREIAIINSKFKNCLTLIYMQASNYGMTRLYDKLNAAAKNELHNVSKQNTTLSSSIDRTDATTNSEWHRLFQRTLFIHTVFMFLIVILIYLWLSTSIPNSSIYLLFITIIALMVLIFNYFRNLHRVVRSEYKHRYWTKMDV